jgi:hypothetical protein
MKFKAQSKTEQILMVMKVLAWIAFFGFAVQIGAYIFSYVVSYFNPEGAGNLYMGMDLLELRNYNFFKYTVLVACWEAFLIMKAIVWYRFALIISTIKLKNPFTMEIAQRLEKISYLLFSIWIMGYIGSAYAGWLGEIAESMHDNWNAGEFLFIAGIMFIVSQIFKHGVELQSENDLTV